MFQLKFLVYKKDKLCYKNLNKNLQKKKLIKYH